MEVLDLQTILDGFAAEFIGRAVTDSALDSTARHPGREAEAVVVAARALGILRCRLTTELAAPDDEGFAEEPTLFEIRQQPGDREIGLPGMQVVVDFQVAVGVPVVVVVGSTGVNLNEADPAFDEPAGQQKLPCRRLRLFGLSRP